MVNNHCCLNCGGIGDCVQIRSKKVGFGLKGIGWNYRKFCTWKCLFEWINKQNKQKDRMVI